MSPSRTPLGICPAPARQQPSAPDGMLISHGTGRTHAVSRYKLAAAAAKIVVLVLHCNEVG